MSVCDPSAGFEGRKAEQGGNDHLSPFAVSLPADVNQRRGNNQLMTCLLCVCVCVCECVFRETTPINQLASKLH